MDNFTIDVEAAARLGAACLGARSPWATVAAAGANHALERNLAPVVAGAGTPRSPRSAVSGWIQAQPATPLPQFVAMDMAEMLPMTTPVTRKPKNVHKTRINAGGYGAMGPHPERERLA